MSDRDSPPVITPTQATRLMEEARFALLTVGAVDPKPTLGDVDPEDREYDVRVQQFLISA